jgi:hypothetical protein
VYKILPTNYKITICEGNDKEAIDWCKNNLELHQWSIKEYTSTYEHTMFFVDPLVATRFEKLFSI